MGRNHAGWVLCVLLAASGCAGDGRSGRRVPWDRTVFQESTQQRPPADPFPQQTTLGRIFPALNRPQFEPLSGSFVDGGSSEQPLRLARAQEGVRTSALAPDDYQIDEELEVREPIRRSSDRAGRTQLADRTREERSRSGPDDTSVVRTQNNFLNDEVDDSPIRRIPRLPVPIVVEIDPELLPGKQVRSTRPDPVMEEALPGRISTGSIASSARKVPASARTGNAPPMARPASAATNSTNMPDWVQSRVTPDSTPSMASNFNGVSNYPLSVRRTGRPLGQVDEPVASSVGRSGSRAVARSSERLARVDHDPDVAEAPPLDLGPPATEAEAVKVPVRTAASQSPRAPQAASRPTRPAPPMEVELFPARPTPEAVAREVESRLAESGLDLSTPAENLVKPAPPAATVAAVVAQPTPIAAEQVKAQPTEPREVLAPIQPPTVSVPQVAVVDQQSNLAEAAAAVVAPQAQVVEHVSERTAEVIEPVTPVIADAPENLAGAVAEMVEENLAPLGLSRDTAQEAIVAVVPEVEVATHPVPDAAQDIEVVTQPVPDVAQDIEVVTQPVAEAIEQIREQATQIVEVETQAAQDPVGQVESQALASLEPSTAPVATPTEVPAAIVTAAEPVVPAPLQKPGDGLTTPTDEPIQTRSPVQARADTSAPQPQANDLTDQPIELTTDLWPGAARHDGRASSAAEPVSLPEVDPEMALVPAPGPQAEEVAQGEGVATSPAKPSHSTAPGTYKEPRKTALNAMRDLFADPFKLADKPVSEPKVAQATVLPEPADARERAKTDAVEADKKIVQQLPPTEPPRGRPRMPLVRAWRDGLSAELPPIQFPVGYYEGMQAGTEKARLRAGEPAKAFRGSARDPQTAPARVATSTNDSRGRQGLGLFRRWRERWEGAPQATTEAPVKPAPSDPIITR